MTSTSALRSLFKHAVSSTAPFTIRSAFIRFTLAAGASTATLGMIAASTPGHVTSDLRETVTSIAAATAVAFVLDVLCGLRIAHIQSAGTFNARALPADTFGHIRVVLLGLTVLLHATICALSVDDVRAHAPAVGGAALMFGACGTYAMMHGGYFLARLRLGHDAPDPMDGASPSINTKDHHHVESTCSPSDPCMQRCESVNRRIDLVAPHRR